LEIDGVVGEVTGSGTIKIIDIAVGHGLHHAVGVRFLYEGKVGVDLNLVKYAFVEIAGTVGCKHGKGECVLVDDFHFEGAKVGSVGAGVVADDLGTVVVRVLGFAAAGYNNSEC